jgi:hypothetical protein
LCFTLFKYLNSLFVFDFNNLFIYLFKEDGGEEGKPTESGKEHNKTNEDKKESVGRLGSLESKVSYSLELGLETSQSLFSLRRGRSFKHSTIRQRGAFQSKVISKGKHIREDKEGLRKLHSGRISLLLPYFHL